MSDAARRAGFFALEAGEYLAELEGLAAAPERPEAERLVRGARALRGAALMAGLGSFAKVAAELERLARMVADGALAWDPAIRTGWRDALAALRDLVDRAAQWEPNDDRHATSLAAQLERLAGGIPAPTLPPAVARQPAGSGPPLTPGVRAFLSRETGLIAGALEQAAAAHVAYPPTAALQAVLERMHALRGLGAASDLSPLPELLDAMELATRSLLTDAPPPPGVGAVLADAAAALSRMARSIGDTGRVVVPDELQTVGRRLLHGYASEDDVVPVEALAPTGADPIALAGHRPGAAPDAAPVAIELVSVGDHLAAAADALEHPTSPAARDLRLFVLHRTLATMPVQGGTGRFLAPLAGALARAVARGDAQQDPDRFVARLREAATFLGTAGDPGGVADLDAARDALARRLGGGDTMPPPAPPADDLAGTPIVGIAALAPEPAPEPEPAAAPEREDRSDVVAIASLAPEPEAPLDIVAIESLAPEPEAPLDIVAIETLAPDPDADDLLDIVPIESLAPDAPAVVAADAPGAPGRLELAFRRRAEREREAPAEGPSLAGLLGEEVTDMDALLLTGEAAMARAEELRGEIAAILGNPLISLEQLRPLIDELLDLVPLARRVA